MHYIIADGPRRTRVETWAALQEALRLVYGPCAIDDMVSEQGLTSYYTVRRPSSGALLAIVYPVAPDAVPTAPAPAPRRVYWRRSERGATLRLVAP